MTSDTSSQRARHTQPTSAYAGSDRRNGQKDRRTANADRRDEDRVAEELVPRRNADQTDRRHSQP